VLRAAYTDRGANGAPAALGEKVVVLRAPTVVVASGQVADGVQKYKGPEVPVDIAIVFSAVAPVPQLNSADGKVEVRLDSATGPLVGETEVIQPNPAMAPPTRLRAALRPTTGVHDLYFVFRNEQARDGQNLFVPSTATFERGAR
jgi:cytochrome c